MVGRMNVILHDTKTYLGLMETTQHFDGEGAFFADNAFATATS